MDLAISGALLRWLVFCLASHTHDLVSVHSIGIESGYFLGRDAIYHLLSILIIETIEMSFMSRMMVGCSSCMCDSQIPLTIGCCGRLLAHVVEDYLRRVITGARLLMEHYVLVLATCSPLSFDLRSLRRVHDLITWLVSLSLNCIAVHTCHIAIHSCGHILLISCCCAKYLLLFNIGIQSVALSLACIASASFIKL